MPDPASAQTDVYFASTAEDATPEIVREFRRTGGR